MKALEIDAKEKHGMAVEIAPASRGKSRTNETCNADLTRRMAYLRKRWAKCNEAKQQAALFVTDERWMNGREGAMRFKTPSAREDLLPANEVDDCVVEPICSSRSDA